MPQDKDEDRIISSSKSSSDNFENVLRPQRLTDFVGQSALKESLLVYIKAAKKRKESLDHILLSGPPGLGKTTLSYIVGNELGVNVKVVSAPMLEKTGEMAAHLTSLEDRDIFFIDEIHRLRITIEEVLYSAMEDFKLDIIIGQGAGARTVRINLPKFTLIGATTRTGLLSNPLLNRFGITFRLDLYPEKALSIIAKQSAINLKIKIDDESALEIAKRSRGTPRIVNRLIKRVRDFAQIKGDGDINLDITRFALDKMNIDEEGLDPLDRKLLRVIIEDYQGGPVGLDTLAISLNEKPDTICDVYEPFLIQKGFIARTPRGRIVTPKSYNYLGITYRKNSSQNSLF